MLQRLIFVVCIAMAGAGCGGVTSAGSSDGRDEMRVTRGELRPKLLLTGTLEAVESTRFQVPNTPQRQVSIQWLAEDGAEVKAGDTVIEFDNSAAVAEVDDLRLAVLRARRDLERVTAQVEASVAQVRSAMERSRINLRKAELDAGVPRAVFAEFEYEQRQLALERARSDLAQAQQDLHVQERSGESEIRIAEVELEKAQRRLSEAENAIDTLSIKAPRDGIFIVGSNRWEGRKIAVGDEVWMGIAVGSLPVLETMQARTRLSDVDDGKIAVGADVWCTLDSFPGTRYPGTIDSISEVAQAPDFVTQRRFFDVIVSLRSSDPERMRPGMSVQVEVPLEGIADGLLVPRSAIDFSSRPPRLRLAGGRWREVDLGPCSSTHCSVTGDVTSGVRVEPARGIE